MLDERAASFTSKGVEQLSKLDVLVVDCQTTGASPSHGAVLELGWGVTSADTAGIRDAETHWVTLPPGHFVDFQVRRLTGFDEAEVTSTLSPQHAWQRLRATTHFRPRIPTAIHFAKFELAFLRDWASRFEPRIDFPLDAVCLHAIACRLFPDLPRRSLRALSGYLGHGLDPARRCLGHVEATAFIWRKLAALLAAMGVCTWEDLENWLAVSPPPAAGKRKRRYPLPSARYRSLPDEPGVYRFVRSNGDVLYVGKAMSLRKRVGSHFTAGTSTSERALEMLTQVHDVAITRTRTALEAALLENEDIKNLRPPYNVQLLGSDPRTWFSTTQFDAVAPEPDEAHRCGPLPSIFSVLSFGAICALTAGKRATPALRARAVGAAEYRAPDEDVFRSGFSYFMERHSLGATSDARRALVLTAKRLIVASKSDGASRAELEAEETGTAPDDARNWDLDRVVRHLERAVAQAYQLLQRARWLCLLHDSDVVFRELPGNRPRLLSVRGGRVVEARDFIQDDAALLPLSYRPLRQRQASFDRSCYDRLRTLTTELRRVMRDNGTAAIRVGRDRWLGGVTLEGLLRWV